MASDGELPRRQDGPIGSERLLNLDATRAPAGGAASGRSHYRRWRHLHRRREGSSAAASVTVLADRWRSCSGRAYPAGPLAVRRLPGPCGEKSAPAAAEEAEAAAAYGEWRAAESRASTGERCPLRRREYRLSIKDTYLRTDRLQINSYG